MKLLHLFLRMHGQELKPKKIDLQQEEVEQNHGGKKVLEELEQEQSEAPYG